MLLPIIYAQVNVYSLTLSPGGQTLTDPNNSNSLGKVNLRTYCATFFKSLINKENFHVFSIYKKNQARPPLTHRTTAEAVEATNEEVCV